ncbi:MAG: S-methyl-5-thioribose-1-phosphate isomerase [Planctomycetaceae bacterium]
MDSSSEHHLFTLRWEGGAQGHLVLIDQTRLPLETVLLHCRSIEEVWQAIQRLSVRGAPAIGVAAAYGIVIGVQSHRDRSRDEFLVELNRVGQYLATSRPTAVNLFWAIDRMTRKARELTTLDSPALLDQLLTEARSIEAEDQAMCLAIGQHGSTLMQDGMGVLTHCNAGGLATAGDGTALSVFFAAARQGKRLHVYADETRPLLQGARLTTWELMQRGIKTTLICDSMAGWVMQEGKIQAVVTGADRIAANGDAANKIGTYSVAQLAKAHNIPFYVAAPSSTFDLSLASGREIPIEERSAEEVTEGFGRRTAPHGVHVYSPAFDVTPATLITALITEKGLIQPVTTSQIAAVLSRG